MTLGNGIHSIRITRVTEPEAPSILFLRTQTASTPGTRSPEASSTMTHIATGGSGWTLSTPPAMTGWSQASSTPWTSSGTDRHIRDPLLSSQFHWVDARMDCCLSIMLCFPACSSDYGGSWTRKGQMLTVGPKPTTPTWAGIGDFDVVWDWQQSRWKLLTNMLYLLYVCN